MADDKFKLPQSSYEEITKIIKAYGHLAKEVSLDEVSRLTSLHTTIISRNVGFLLAVGLLLPGSKKAITDVGRQLARALDHEMPDEIRESWRTIVLENDFLSKCVTAVRIRNGMDHQTLESHIAYSAGQPKKAQIMTGTRTVIEILRAAELIRDFDGKYVTDGESTSFGERPSSKTIEPTPIPSGSMGKPELVRHVASVQHQVAHSVVININVTCTAAEVRDLGAQLRKLIRDLDDQSNAEA